MDLAEKLLESHKALSRINVTLLAAVLVMSVYVLQRALAVIGVSPDLLRGLTSKDLVQISFFDLGFSYRTMTVLWPGVLGGLCLLYTILEAKRGRIERALRGMNDSAQRVEVAEVDPLHVSASLLQSRLTRRMATVFALFPLTAIVAHLIMILMWVASLGWYAYRRRRLMYWLGRGGFVGVAAGSVFSLVSISFAVLGFFGALAFLYTSRRILDDAEPRVRAQIPADRPAADRGRRDG